jgi:hypothetical protein
MTKTMTGCFQFIVFNSLYIFKHLFAHHQEALYIQQLVYLCAYYFGWLLAGLGWNQLLHMLVQYILMMSK